MITLKITDNIDIVNAKLTIFGDKQVSYATSRAINQVAYISQSALKQEMSKVFDRPKPYVLNSVFIKRSTPANLTATIYHSDKVANVINPEIVGGVRYEKKFETIAGISGVFVPTRNIQLDSYGNPTVTTISKILSQAQPVHAGSEFVLVKPGEQTKLKPGIYQRVNGRIIMLFAYRESAKYKPRYDMLGVVQKVLDQEMDAQLNYYLDESFRTGNIGFG